MKPAMLVVIAVSFWLQEQANHTSKPGQGAKEDRLEQFKQEAAEYEIRLGADSQQQLTLRTDPILHWGNPVRNEDAGAAFLWLDKGRPAVVGTVFTYRYVDDSIRMCHELHSLASTAIAAHYQGHRVWYPTKAGVEFQPVPDAASPAESAPIRLSQMRTLAREFTANSKDYKDRTWELRLLPQPLYRYETTSDDLPDGALFAFCVGTDPEVLLVLEARRNQGNPQWHFAIARFSDAQLWVRHKNHEVWKAAASPAIQGNILADQRSQQEPYICFHPKLIKGNSDK